MKEDWFHGRENMERRYGGFLPKPVKVGEEYDVDIIDVASKGDGIAKIKGLVIFVPGTQKGEKAHIKITSVGKKFAIAERI